MFPDHLSGPRHEIDTKLQAPEGQGKKKKKEKKKGKKTPMPGLWCSSSVVSECACLEANCRERLVRE